MGWPKGKPRGKRMAVPRSDMAIDVKQKVSRKVLMEPDVSDMPQEAQTPVLHGMTTYAVTEPCPNCLYAYADGGFCPECGWNKPFRLDEYGTNSGRRF